MASVYDKVSIKVFDIIAWKYIYFKEYIISQN